MQIGVEDRRPRRWLPKFLLLAALVVLALGGLAIWRVGAPATVKIDPQRRGIGKRTPIDVTVSEPGRGVGRVKVELVQGETVFPLAEQVHTQRPFWAFWGARTPSVTLRVEPGRETLPELRSGDAVVRVTAERAGTWLRGMQPVVEELRLPVRLQPPSLQVTSNHVYVAQGGCEAVVYRVGDGSARDGVRAGDWFFPGAALPGGDVHARFALFAVPYDMPDASGVRLITEDEVGNEAQVAFIEKFFPRPFGVESIQLDDAYLQRVVPAIMAETPNLKDLGSPLANYLQINRDLRRQNSLTFKTLAARSVDEFLWREAFLPLPNGKVMSHFADRRTYMYQGKPVDHQDHLGFDLASVQHAPVPAANRGVVVLAHFHGIFGNAVVLDHGHGLMSLYAHLSVISVQEGQTVDRGTILGQSGSTGLAGGDHLHYTTLLQGLPVNPVEWWDSHWIHDRLKEKLGAALPTP